MSDKVHDNFYHSILFLRTAFGNEQSKGNKGCIVNSLIVHIVIENAVLVHKPKKEGSGNTLVAITETVVLGDKIQEHGCFLLYGRIKILTSECLIYLAYATLETVVLLVCEESASAKFLSQFRKDVHCTFVCSVKLLLCGTFWYAQPLVIIVVKTVKGESVVHNHIKQGVAHFLAEVCNFTVLAIERTNCTIC